MNNRARKNEVEVIGIYSIPNEKDIYLIELIVHQPPSLVDLNSFLLKDENTDRNDWQAPFDEYYLDEKGETIIGDFYNHKSLLCCLTRVTFFMYMESLGKILSTPYGDILLDTVTNLPPRLSMISYMQMD